MGPLQGSGSVTRATRRPLCVCTSGTRTHLLWSDRRARGLVAWVTDGHPLGWDLSVWCAAGGGEYPRTGDLVFFEGGLDPYKLVEAFSRGFSSRV